MLRILKAIFRIALIGFHIWKLVRDYYNQR